MKWANPSPAGEGFAHIGSRAAAGALTVILALAVGGCRGEPGPSDAGPSGDGDQANRLEVVVTRDNPNLPEACRPRALAGRITDLLDALNRGDRAALEASFAPERRFAVYAAPRDPLDTETPSDELVFAVRDHSKLVARILDARSEGDRLRLLSVEGACGFGFYARADRDDHPSTLLTGKGELDPRSGQFEVFVLSNPAVPAWDLEQMCGETLEPRGPVVACSEAAGR